MNVSSQPLVLPANHHRRRLLPTTHSPIAVSNKIKAIQARKTRLNPLPSDSDYTDVRPLNFGYTGGATNSRTNVTVWTAERLVDRSKDVRLDRIATRQPARPSVLSSTTISQQSLLWPNYQPLTVENKQLQTQSNSTTITPPAIGSIKTKSPGGKKVELPRRRIRQPLIERQNTTKPTEPPQKTSQMPPITSPERTNENHHHHFLLPKDINENEEDVTMDKEFEQYLEKAMVKCADWLIKYVFKEKDN